MSSDHYEKRIMKKEIVRDSLIFIILIGIVSLLSDMTHEGAKSIYGQFLNIVGASPKVISFVGGLGEFLGSALIFVTSIIASKTKKYWTMTIIGYTINLFCIPMLALTTENGWIYAISLILLERVGKAIRKPAKNTLVSFCSKNLGEGKSFALLECLDQIGAFIGPLILTLVLYLKGTTNLFDSYKFCFLILIIPAILTLCILLFARVKYPTPETFEDDKEEDKSNQLVISKSFKYYLVAISLVAFSFIDFPLITYHVASLNIINEKNLPMLYSLAMLVDSISALIFGFLFDKIGFKTLVLSTLLSMTFPLFIFNFNMLYSLAMLVDSISALIFGFLFDKIGFKTLVLSTLLSMTFPLFIFNFNNSVLIIIGICLWGVGMGAQESILKSSVAKLSTKETRSKCFGLFEGVFGLSWFIGSSVLGIIYEASIIAFIIIPIILQICAIICYILSIRNYSKA